LDREKEHTSREFERELRTLRERLLAMGGRAERSIERAVEALVRRDDRLAGQVITEDARIDLDEVEIDELAFDVLARRQPVASDLRFVMLALKIVTDLERIGDLSANIAKRERQLALYPPSPMLPELEALARLTMAALRRVLDAFVHADADAAERVIREDAQIDAGNNRIISALLSDDGLRAGDLARALAVTSVSRYLERIGDHATNVAEMVIYFVRGRDVRHHHTPDAA
jgi:phosphate transport system protein